jgi:hypothetical protein
MASVTSNSNSTSGHQNKAFSALFLENYQEKVQNEETDSHIRFTAGGGNKR